MIDTEQVKLILTPLKQHKESPGANLLRKLTQIQLNRYCNSMVI